MLHNIYEPDHDALRQLARQFVDTEIADNVATWEDARRIDASLWPKAAAHGLLGVSLPEEYGGGGVADFRYRAVILEELARVGATSVKSGFSIVDDLVGPYLVDLGTDEQKQRWIPGLCAGTQSASLAMTEPGAGSDLRGIRSHGDWDGDSWVLNGSKTFITNGANADIIVVLARTDHGSTNAGFSLLVVESDMPGFSRGRTLETLGRRADGIAELFFDDVRVPAKNLLGVEGRGLAHCMERLPTERMSIACFALASAESILRQTVAHTKQRSMFGRTLADLQNTRFVLAELDTEIDIARIYVNQAVLALNDGTLTPADAAKAKWWTTELLQRVATSCLQLHGGYGYTLEYPIARAFVDARAQSIYGGATEVMKEVIARELLD